MLRCWARKRRVKDGRHLWWAYTARHLHQQPATVTSTSTPLTSRQWLHTQTAAVRSPTWHRPLPDSADTGTRQEVLDTTRLLPAVYTPRRKASGYRAISGQSRWAAQVRYLSCHVVNNPLTNRDILVTIFLILHWHKYFFNWLLTEHRTGCCLR